MFNILTDIYIFHLSFFHKLHVAAKWGKSQLAVLLLQHGANIEARTRDGLVSSYSMRNLA